MSAPRRHALIVLCAYDFVAFIAFVIVNWSLALEKKYRVQYHAMAPHLAPSYQMAVSRLSLYSSTRVWVGQGLS
jgi:hypothetical protein